MNEEKENCATPVLSHSSTRKSLSSRPQTQNEQLLSNKKRLFILLMTATASGPAPFAFTFSFYFFRPRQINLREDKSALPFFVTSSLPHLFFQFTLSVWLAFLFDASASLIYYCTSSSRHCLCHFALHPFCPSPFLSHLVSSCLYFLFSSTNATYQSAVVPFAPLDESLT